jgi:hypothetical protein
MTIQVVPDSLAKCYAVRSDCERQVKNFSGAIYQGCKTARDIQTGLSIPQGTSLRLHAVSNHHAPNCSPSLTSAAPKCTIPAFLHHPVHSHRPSILSRHSSTFPTFMPYLRPAPRCTLLLPSTATFHLLVPLNVLTTTTLLRLSGFFHSFTSHSPTRSHRRILLTGIKYILLLCSTILVLLISVVCIDMLLRP